MVELTFILRNGTKKVYEFDDVEVAKRAGQNMVEFAGEVIEKYEIEEYEIIDDDDYADYSSNNPCDTYGMCAGMSCSHYWECHK